MYDMFYTRECLICQIYQLRSHHENPVKEKGGLFYPAPIPVLIFTFHA